MKLRSKSLTVVLIFILMGVFLLLTSTDVALARAVTLDEAQRDPGVYIKEGNLFTRIEGRPKRGWGNSSLGLGQERGTFVDNNHTLINLAVFLLDADIIIPKIANTAQIVIIGRNSLQMRKITPRGYTIPYRISLSRNRDKVEVSMFGDVYTAASSLSVGTYESINGRTPQDYANRIIPPGIITANKNEVFSFGRFKGTSFTEDSYTANRQAFTQDNRAVKRFEEIKIERTKNGYFIINFATVPIGYYYLGDSIVEFVTP